MHVPYKGGAPALTDLMGGQVDMMFSAASASGPHVKSGKLRAIATSGLERSNGFPDLPTVAESGIPGFSLYEWNSLFARGGTPAPILQKLESEVRQIMAQPDVRQRFAELGAETVGSTSEELREFVRTETAKWAKVIREAKVRID
jgi:tripartite-type tricarboxylate transporter receptor subunit TctC